MDRLFQNLILELLAAQSSARDIEPVARLRFFIRRYVCLAARYPEIHRIMLDEGKRNDWRLKWIVENYSRQFYARVELLVAEAKRLGVSTGIDGVHFYYVLISGAVIFAMGPECELLSGKDPQTDTMIDAHANAIANLLIREQVNP